MSGEAAERLRARNLQLRAAVSAIRDLAEQADGSTTLLSAGDANDQLRAIKAVCDEQLARNWDDPDDEEGD